jgi:predicted nucleic acid-binding protein
VVFLDTNVVVYALHSQDGAVASKSDVARELLASRPNLSLQVINEAFHVLHRKYGQSREQATRSARFLIDQARVFDVKLGDLELALELGNRHSLSHYDSLIVGNALNNGAEVLYSEDMHNGLVLEGRLRIVNPFAG